MELKEEYLSALAEVHLVTYIHTSRPTAAPAASEKEKEKTRET